MDANLKPCELLHVDLFSNTIYGKLKLFPIACYLNVVANWDSQEPAIKRNIEVRYVAVNISYQGCPMIICENCKNKWEIA